MTDKMKNKQLNNVSGGILRKEYKVLIVCSYCNSVLRTYDSKPTSLTSMYCSKCNKDVPTLIKMD